MKTNKRFFQKIILVPLGIILILLLTGIHSCTSIKQKHQVMLAYTLRIDGYADSAKVLLQRFTADDPKDALAWYELCRTTKHVGMANPRAIKEMLDETLGYINLAVENDPDNAWYLSYKGSIVTLQYYLALQTGDEKAGEYLIKVEDTYKAVFQLDPTYYENKLTLVEFFGMLPPEMGGDPEKAEKYAAELEEADLVYGAKAREILMPEDADYETYWKEIVEKVPESADAHQALGRIYLFMDNIDEATICFQKAIDLDSSKDVLYLDLGRYYLMGAMQNPAIIDSVKPMIEEQFNKYLNFKPEPVKPMKAWTYGQLSMINRRNGNEEAAKKYKEMAQELDPFYSRASGKPGKALFCPPEVVVHDQGYYFSPF